MTMSAPLKARRRWQLRLDLSAIIAAGAIVLDVLIGTLSRIRW